MTAFTMNLAEGIGVADAVPVQDVSVAFAETVGIAETSDVQPLLALAETLGIAETSIDIDVALALAEALGITEFLPFNSNMVMENIKVVDVFQDLFEFTTKARADRVLGFDPFSRLIPGDKDYQNGILKLTVRAPTNLGEDRIDVDDRDDNVALPASVTTISYNKQFQRNVSPSVTIVGAASPVFFEMTSLTLFICHANSFRLILCGNNCIYKLYIDRNRCARQTVATTQRMHVPCTATGTIVNSGYGIRCINC